MGVWADVAAEQGTSIWALGLPVPRPGADPTTGASASAESEPLAGERCDEFKRLESDERNGDVGMTHRLAARHDGWSVADAPCRDLGPGGEGAGVQLIGPLTSLGFNADLYPVAAVIIPIFMLALALALPGVRLTGLLALPVAFVVVVSGAARSWRFWRSTLVTPQAPSTPWCWPRSFCSPSSDASAA